MLDASSPAAPGSPHYLDEVERLTGVPFFTDQERACALRNGPEKLSPQDIAERKLLYTAGLRLLAERKRYGERENFQDRARFIGQQLLLINNAEEYGSEAPAHFRPHQRPITNFMLNMLIKRPEQHQLTEIARTGHTAEELFTKGGIFVSATGTGKTVQERAVFTQLGIDSEENQRRSTPLWGLLIAGGRDAVRQFAGLTGDDTFRRFGPEVPVTPFFDEEQDNSGLIVVTTKQMFVQKFRNNAFDGRPMPAVIVVDEAHRITEPLMQKTLTGHYRGPTIGFTATPTYRPEKDAEKILPYVIRRGDMLSDTRDGILNGAQLFTFTVDPRLDKTLASTLNLTNSRIFEQAGKLLLNRAVVEYVTDRVATGRRGIVYCQRGDQSAHSQELALALSGKTISLPDGSKQQIVAKAIGVFQTGKENDKAIRDYHAGKVHVLIAVEKVVESFNGDVDFIAFAVRTTSLLRLRQMIGRGTRPSETFPITEYAEFMLPRTSSADPDYVNLWDAFGLSEIHQGQVITQKRGSSANSGVDAYPVKLAIQGLIKEMPILRLEDLPLKLQEYSRNATKQIREIVIGKGIRTVVPEGYIPLHAIMRAIKHGKSFTQSSLSDFPHYATWENVSEDDEELVRYYPPEALEYLLVTKQLEIKSSTEFLTPFGISKAAGCSLGFARRAIDLGTALGLPGFEPQGSKMHVGKRVFLYGREVLEFTQKKFAEIPGPYTGECTIDELADELGASRQFTRAKVKAFGIKTLPRRKPNSFLGAYMAYADAECIRADFYAVPLARADEFSLYEVLRLARHSQHPETFTPKDLAKTEQRRCLESPGTVQSMLPLDAALNFIDRFLPTSLPEYLVPRMAIRAMINKSGTMVKKALEEYGVPIRLKLPDAHALVTCYPWEALFFVAKKYGFKENILTIHDHMLPNSPYDTASEKRAYARSIQERCLRPEMMLRVPTFEEVKKEALEIVTGREKYRKEYLSQYDRAARWAGIVPCHEAVQSPTPPTEVVQPTVTSYTREEIAQRAGVSLSIVEDVLAKLAPEYKTNQTAEERIEANGLKRWAYKGKYLDAILMTLIGRTPERIAEIAGMPISIVTNYLQNYHQANERCRYDLKALIAVLAEFRRPPSRGYRLLDEVATEIGAAVSAVTETIGRYGGKVEFFYNHAGEKNAYVSSFSEKLAMTILVPSRQDLPKATSGFYNRFEIKKAYPEYSYTTIDKCLQVQAAVERAVWLRVRNRELAEGAKVLPHYPLRFFEELIAIL